MRGLKVLLYLGISALLALNTACGGKQLSSATSYEPDVHSVAPSSPSTDSPPPAELTYKTVMKQDILCLMLAYPGYITGVEAKDGNVYVVMKSGRRILYDDKKSKGFEQKISNADIQDMMEQVYPLSEVKNLMPLDFDPGRFRVYALLDEVYGSSRQKIQSNLVTAKTACGNFQFSGMNGAPDALKAVMSELKPLTRESARISSFVFPMGGTYNYRTIAGTNLLSAHAYGIAIDLVSSKKDYWKWTSREEGEKRAASYPGEIVKIFEKNHFIWGGKWGHFDFMHFEYRPELILKATYFSDTTSSDSSWYERVPSDTPSLQDYVQIIEKAIDL